MPTLRIIGSSSSGNTYLLETSKETLILDLGCKWSEIMEGLNYKIDRVCGCLVTHLHSDHTKSIPNALKYGISVFSNQDVVDKFIGVKVLDTRQKYKIGSFVVTALPVTHNVVNYAYMIEHEETGKIVFITDAVNFPYKIKGVNHLLIESNYDENLIIDHLCENQDIRSNNQYHMEINEAIKAIKRLYSSDLNTLVLCHLSDGQSDERAFQQRVFDEVGIYPHVANKHMVIELSKEEF